MFPAILPTYARAPLRFVKGEGSWLIEADGRRFLDLSAGIAVNALGHAHPALVDALTTQAKALWHTSNLYHIPQQETLATRLVDTTFADTVFFTNSGSEACELAVKMVRRYWHEKAQPRRQTILTFSGAFHGRSSAAIAAGGSAKLVDGFAPLLAGFRQLDLEDRQAWRAAIDETVAAVMIEPIQGEGGIVVVPEADLRDLRALCDATGALLVLDEVQCGMGRTGRLFAHEWAGIVPDVMLVAKGIGGGFPIGAVLATRQAAGAMTAGTHGSTYGGNPLACAVGNAVLDIVADPAFLMEVNRKAGHFRQRLEALVAGHADVFGQVRGKGLMLGLECTIPSARVIEAAHAHRVCLVSASGNVVRLLPPLTITDAEIVEASRRLDAAAAMATSHAGAA